MGMDDVWESRDGENSVSTCGCKDANARLDECCIWECGAVTFRRTSEKTRCPGVPVQYGPLALGAPKMQRTSPTIAHRRGGCVRGCTSLPCTSGTVHTLCPTNPRTGVP